MIERPANMSDLRRLAQPFPRALIQKAPQGKFGSYVSHNIVNERALEVVGPHSFGVTEIIRDPDGLVTGCLAMLEVEIDGRLVAITEVGDCDDDFGQKHTNSGQRVKLCASDAYKRAWMRLGLGLHLWSGEEYNLHERLRRQEVAQDALPRDWPATPVSENPDKVAHPPHLLPSPRQDRAPGEVHPGPDTEAEEADGTSPSAEVSSATPVPEAVASPPAVSGTDDVLAQIPASPARVYGLQEQVAYLNARGVKVSEERKKRGLTIITKGMSEALAREWEDLIVALNAEVTGLNQGRMTVLGELTATGDPPPDDDEPF